MYTVLLAQRVTAVVLLQVVSEADGQGISIDGNGTFNYWNWPNAVIFAATVITTIGEYFNIQGLYLMSFPGDHVALCMSGLLSTEASGQAQCPEDSLGNVL